MTFIQPTAHCPTLLIDEADSFLKDNEELRGAINSDHTRQSAYVIRCVGDDHEPCQFSTWGAKAISGIGQLADTLMDRSVVLTLRRKLPTESVQRLRHADQSLFCVLASKLARFSSDASHPALGTERYVAATGDFTWSERKGASSSQMRSFGVYLIRAF